MSLRSERALQITENPNQWLQDSALDAFKAAMDVQDMAFDADFDCSGSFHQSMVIHLMNLRRGDLSNEEGKAAAQRSWKALQMLLNDRDAFVADFGTDQTAGYLQEEFKKACAVLEPVMDSLEAREVEAEDMPQFLEMQPLVDDLMASIGDDASRRAAAREGIGLPPVGRLPGPTGGDGGDGGPPDDGEEGGGGPEREPRNFLQDARKAYDEFFRNGVRDSDGHSIFTRMTGVPIFRPVPCPEGVPDVFDDARTSPPNNEKLAIEWVKLMFRQAQELEKFRHSAQAIGHEKKCRDTSFDFFRAITDHLLPLTSEWAGQIGIQDLLIPTSMVNDFVRNAQYPIDATSHFCHITLDATGRKANIDRYVDKSLTPGSHFNPSQHVYVPFEVREQDKAKQELEAYYAAIGSESPESEARQLMNRGIHDLQNRLARELEATRKNPEEHGVQTAALLGHYARAFEDRFGQDNEERAGQLRFPARDLEMHLGLRKGSLGCAEVFVKLEDESRRWKVLDAEAGEHCFDDSLMWPGENAGKMTARFVKVANQLTVIAHTQKKLEGGNETRSACASTLSEAMQDWANKDYIDTRFPNMLARFGKVMNKLAKEVSSNPIDRKSKTIKPLFKQAMQELIPCFLPENYMAEENGAIGTRAMIFDKATLIKSGLAGRLRLGLSKGPFAFKEDPENKGKFLLVNLGEIRERDGLYYAHGIQMIRFDGKSMEIENHFDREPAYVPVTEELMKKLAEKDAPVAAAFEDDPTDEVRPVGMAELGGVPVLMANTDGGGEEDPTDELIGAARWNHLRQMPGRLLQGAMETRAWKMGTKPLADTRKRALAYPVAAYLAAMGGVLTFDSEYSPNQGDYVSSQERLDAQQKEYAAYHQDRREAYLLNRQLNQHRETIDWASSSIESEKPLTLERLRTYRDYFKPISEGLAANEAFLLDGLYARLPETIFLGDIDTWNPNGHLEKSELLRSTRETKERVDEIVSQLERSIVRMRVTESAEGFSDDAEAWFAEGEEWLDEKKPALVSGGKTLLKIVGSVWGVAALGFAALGIRSKRSSNEEKPERKPMLPKKRGLAYAAALLAAGLGSQAPKMVDTEYVADETAMSAEFDELTQGHEGNKADFAKAHEDFTDFYNDLNSLEDDLDATSSSSRLEATWMPAMADTYQTGEDALEVMNTTRQALPKMFNHNGEPYSKEFEIKRALVFMTKADELKARAEAKLVVLKANETIEELQTDFGDLRERYYGAQDVAELDAIEKSAREDLERLEGANKGEDYEGAKAGYQELIAHVADRRVEFLAAADVMEPAPEVGAVVPAGEYLVAPNTVTLDSALGYAENTLWTTAYKTVAPCTTDLAGRRLLASKLTNHGLTQDMDLIRDVVEEMDSLPGDAARFDAVMPIVKGYMDIPESVTTFGDLLEEHAKGNVSDLALGHVAAFNLDQEKIDEIMNAAAKSGGAYVTCETVRAH